MKKIFLFLLIISISTTLNAQEAIKIPLTKEVGNQWYTFKNSDETIIVQNYHEQRTEEYLITILDSYNKTKKTHKIAETEDLLLNVSFTDNTIYFLFQENKYDEFKIEYYIKSVNVSDFNESRKPLFTAVEDNSKTIKGYFKLRRSSIYGEVIFEDGYTAILYDNRANETRIRTTHLFDKNFNQIFKQAKTYSKDQKDYRYIHAPSFINEANQSLVVFNKTNELNKFHIERTDKTGYTSKNFSFGKDGHHDVKLIKTEKGFHCVGFFLNKDKDVVDAIYSTKFSNDFEVLDEKYIQLSEAFFNDLNKKQKKKGLILDLHSVLVDDNDDLYIIGEAGRIGVSGGSGNMDEFSNFYDIPDDVVACKIDKKGTLLWSRLVNKSQKFYHSHYGHFKPFLINNELHYIFNSEMDLKTVKTDKKSGKSMQPGSGQRFSVYLVSFDNEGAFEHFKLTDKKVDLRYMTTTSSLIKNESILLPGTRKKQHGILKITGFSE